MIWTMEELRRVGSCNGYRRILLQRCLDRVILYEVYKIIKGSVIRAQVQRRCCDVAHP